MSDIRLYIFHGGTIRLPKANVILGGSRDMINTPVPFFVLTHPHGNVVIDGGNAPEVAVDYKKHWGVITEESTWGGEASSVIMSPDQALLPGLERIGVEPESIRWVVQTHLHL